LRIVIVIAPGKEDVMYVKYRARREGDTWRLVIPWGGKPEQVKIKGKGDKEEEVEVLTADHDAEEGGAGYSKKMLPKYQDIREGIIREVKDGKYASREEAKKAFSAADAAFFEANPPPRLEKRPKD